MAQTTVSAPQQQTAMPAVDLRQMFGALIAFEGVHGANDLAVAQRAAGANMSVDVAVGAAAVKDDHASGGGFYSYTLAATANLAVSTSDPTNPRIDRVVARVRDQALGDAANDTGVVVVAGTPTAGATLTNLNGAATVPGSSLLLANVLVPAASSSVTTANIDTTVRRLVNEADYKQVTANVTSTATTTAGAVAVITGNPITLDGATTVQVDVYIPFLVHSVSAVTMAVELFDASSDIAQLGELTSPTANGGGPFRATYIFTPSAASHTYSARVWSGAAGTATAQAAAGSGAGVQVPMFLRVTKA